MPSGAEDAMRSASSLNQARSSSKHRSDKYVIRDSGQRHKQLELTSMSSRPDHDNLSSPSGVSLLALLRKSTDKIVEYREHYGAPRASAQEKDGVV
jgi:hypothetical protein